METEETKQIKGALYERGRKLTRHGVQEVTIGHILGSKGYDRCDYVEFDNNGNFYAYEIKVTVNELKSGNKLSYCANKNYIVINHQIYDWLFKIGPDGQREIKHNFNHGGFGLILYQPNKRDKFTSITRCGNQQLGLGERMELLEAIAKAGCRDAGKYWSKKG